MLLGASSLTGFFGIPTGASGASASQQDQNEEQRFIARRRPTRSRTRTRTRNASRMTDHSGSISGASTGWTRYSPKDHPLSPQNLLKRGYHTFTCFQMPFRVKKRYTLVRELGVGSYGCVALAYDSETDRHVAIKKMTRFFGRDVLTRRVLREVVSLRHLLHCPNIVEVIEFDVSFIEFNEVYLVLSACDADLFQIIRSTQELTHSHVKYFLVQLLRAVHYMHTAHIVHRDLKPSNLLVNANCTLCVCDFGMSRAFDSDNADYLEKLASLGDPHSWDAAFKSSDSGMRESLCVNSIDITPAHEVTPGTDHSDHNTFLRFAPVTSDDEKEEGYHLETSNPVHYPGAPLTDYVSTRWYRAPEVMLCCHGGYGPAMDMWSVGCILAELLGRTPVFPGSDYVDQLARIHKVLGNPPESIRASIGSERAKQHLESMGDGPGIPWSFIYPDAPEQALDLLSRMLQWDPQKRITAGEALSHPWLRRYREASYSGRVAQPFTRFDDLEYIFTPSEFKRAFEEESAAILQMFRRGQEEHSHSRTPTSPQPSSASCHDDERAYESDTHTDMQSAIGPETPLNECDPELSLAPNSAYDLPSGVNSVFTPGPLLSNRASGCGSSRRLSDSEQRNQKIQKRTDKLEGTLFDRACAFMGWS